ncbi:hypothetical protein FA95DRAFT_1611378 [Auriscalpium vulgare]|uniref:Uncharacterized protein n=1 Tax=Auriscalpium vulgare TaxID=40419 RepID=A0ACB8R9W4_9AGAM|nr:hypothetical protein FA95DRAFT_1611378 [Auriscalpium vulgare]
MRPFAIAFVLAACSMSYAMPIRSSSSGVARAIPVSHLSPIHFPITRNSEEMSLRELTDEDIISLLASRDVYGDLAERGGIPAGSFSLLGTTLKNLVKGFFHRRGLDDAPSDEETLALLQALSSAQDSERRDLGELYERGGVPAGSFSLLGTTLKNLVKGFFHRRGVDDAPTDEETLALLQALSSAQDSERRDLGELYERGGIPAGSFSLLGTTLKNLVKGFFHRRGVDDAPTDEETLALLQALSSAQDSERRDVGELYERGGVPAGSFSLLGTTLKNLVKGFFHRRGLDDAPTDEETLAMLQLLSSVPERRDVGELYERGGIPAGSFSLLGTTLKNLVKGLFHRRDLNGPTDEETAALLQLLSSASRRELQ